MCPCGYADLTERHVLQGCALLADLRNKFWPDPVAISETVRRRRNPQKYGPIHTRIWYNGISAIEKKKKKKVLSRVILLIAAHTFVYTLYTSVWVVLFGLNQGCPARAAGFQCCYHVCIHLISQSSDGVNSPCVGCFQFHSVYRTLRRFRA